MALNKQETDRRYLGGDDIRVGQTLLPLSDYEYENFDLICDAVAGKEKLVILGPASFTTVVLGSVACALKLAESEIKRQSGQLEETLTPGDIVLLEGRRGRFAGVEILGGSAGNKPKFRVEFEDGTVFRDLSDIWQLAKCDPTVGGIDKHVSARGKNAHLPRKHLAEILRIPVEEIPPALRSRVIVVAEKAPMIEAYMSTRIGDVPLPDIVPATYHSSETEYERLHRSTLEPMVCFTRSVEIATGMVETGTNADAVLVNDCGRLRGNLSYVKNLSDYGVPIIVVDHLHRAQETDLRQFESLGFTVFSWTRADVRRLVRGTRSYCAKAEVPLALDRAHLHNFARWRSRRIVIQDSRAELITSIRKVLYSLLRSSGDGVRKLVRHLYFVTNTLTTMPLPGRKLAALGLDLKTVLRDCEASILSLYAQVSGDQYSDLNRVLSEIKTLVERQWQVHPKQEAFQHQLEQLNVSDAVLVSSRRLRDVLLAYCNQERPGTRVLSLKESLSVRSRVFERLLAPGWFGEEHARIPLSGICEEETKIIYPFERVMERRHSERLTSALDHAARSHSRSGASGDTSASFDLEGFLKRVSSDNWRQVSNWAEPDVSDTDQVDATLAVFEGNRVAFLTDSYRCRCLDDEMDEVLDKEVSELKAGDRLIFVRDSAQDVFARLIEIVKNSDPAIQRTIMLAETWRAAFLNYVTKNGLTVIDVQERLSTVGVERSTQAIRSWFDPNTIGPNADAVRGLARLTGDPELNERLDDVLNACTQIRGLHVRIGQYLARSIVAATFGGELDMLDPALEDIFRDVSQHVELAMLIESTGEKHRVPRRLTNRLLEMDDFE